MLYTPNSNFYLRSWSHKPHCRISNVANIAYATGLAFFWKRGGGARGTPWKIFHGTPGYFHVRWVSLLLIKRISPVPCVLICYVINSGVSKNFEKKGAEDSPVLFIAKAHNDL